MFTQAASLASTRCRANSSALPDSGQVVMTRQCSMVNARGGWDEPAYTLPFAVNCMRILHWLLLGILLAPVIELYVLIKVGAAIGPIPTILLVVFTAVAGTALM